MTDKPLLINANIVQAVKICYKRKIDSRDFRGRFYSFLDYEDTPTRHFGLLLLAIVVLLHGNRSNICFVNVAQMYSKICPFYVKRTYFLQLKSAP